MTELIDLLRQATRQERELLSQILCCSDTEPSGLADCLQRVSSSLFAYRVTNERLAYRDVVHRVAERLEVPANLLSTAAVERAIVDCYWSSAWKKMTPQQQQDFNVKLVESAKNSGQLSNLKGVAIAGGGLFTANASGFAVYMGASSVLGALTAGMGFTLPFGVYTAMSSALSIILGPIGFVGLGLWALHSVTGPEYQKMITAVVAIFTIRARIDVENRERHKASWPTWAWPTAAALAIGICLWLTLRQVPRSTPMPGPPPAAPPQLQIPAQSQEVNEVRVGPYLFRVTAQPADRTAKLVIERDGQPVLSEESGGFRIADAVCGQKQWPNPGDLDGSGNLELLVEDYSGGAHCCTSWRLFRTTDTGISESLTINNGNLAECPFSDLDGDGHPEVKVVDEAFVDWRTSFAESPILSLIYRLRPQGLEFAPELMRKEGLSDEELKDRAGKTSWSVGHSAEDPPPELIAMMASLLETGRASSIVQFQQLSWPATVSGRDQFLSDFWKQLRTSKHWEEWKRLNQGVLDSQPNADGRDF